MKGLNRSIRPLIRRPLQDSFRAASAACKRGKRKRHDEACTFHRVHISHNPAHHHLGAAADQNAERAVTVNDSTFKCMTDMTPVRHFYVDNLSGDLKGTVAVAEKGRGDYPQGSVVQLVPTEIMVKQQKGFNPTTHDWEFFAIDVSKGGSKIYQ
jgi:hypothetical protein